MNYGKKRYNEITRLIAAGEVLVMPTDTIYGLVASVFSKKAVEKIYKLKKRDTYKPPVVIIAQISDLKRIGITVSAQERNVLRRIWPEKVSVILPLRLKKFEYLHRGARSIAVRMPKDAWLRKFLKKTGPLATSSANEQGEKPATTVAQAKRKFGSAIALYADGGKLPGRPSTIIKIEKGAMTLIREGAVKAKTSWYTMNNHAIARGRTEKNNKRRSTR
jgi:L-threonylcarbamoyladenylate synthase